MKDLLELHPSPMTQNTLNRQKSPMFFKIAYKQIRSSSYHIQLHFPAVLPTYAFFNDTFKEHLETEYEQVVELVTSKAFESLFVPNGEGEIKGDYEDCLKKSQFLLDLLAVQVDQEDQLKDYMTGIFKQLNGLFDGKGVDNWRFGK
jgi:hypothetical protein